MLTMGNIYDMVRRCRWLTRAPGATRLVFYVSDWSIISLCSRAQCAPPPLLALFHNSNIIQFEGSPYYGCCNILLTQSLASPPKPSPTPFSPELELVLGSIVILRYLKYDQQLATMGAILHKAGVIIILVQVQTWEKFMLKNAFICEA